MSANIYTQTTLATARAQLAERLSDPTNQFWVTAELNSYIIEALRTYNSLARVWRQRGTLNTSPSTPFYDLPSLLAPSSLRSYSVTDQSLYLSICYSLLEPASASPTWIGSEMFTSDDLTQALQRRLNLLFLSTFCNLSRQTLTIAGGSSGRFQLSDSIIDVRRAAWADSSTRVTSSLWVSDEWEMTSLTPLWNTTSGVPSVYSVSATTPLEFQFDAIPASNGTLDFLATLDGPTLNPTLGSGIILSGIPDDFTWVLRWGALADLLSLDGPARDPARAAYCQARWTQGVELLLISPVMIATQINGATTQSVSLAELDRLYPTWQSDTPGTPSVVATCAQNLIAVYPLADSSPHSITCDVVANMPVPSLDSDFLQVGVEILDPILDYAQHLASFKMAGAEFDATIPAYSRLLQIASRSNERLRASSLYKPLLEGHSTRDLKSRPRREAAPRSGPDPALPDLAIQGGDY
ncbi:MAG: hypothetical protein KGL39_15860 [Patescibacteria group bacterium]|nr:hypothetical protein [Patescibacteria group bacterium]